MILFMLPMIIPLAIFSMFCNVLVEYAVETELKKSNQSALSHIGNSTELVFDEIEALSSRFHSNAFFVSQMKQLLATDNEDYADYNSALARQWFMYIINSSMSTKSFIHSVYLYYENDEGNMFASDTGVTSIENHPDKEWFAQYLRAEELPSVYFQTRSVRTYPFEEAGTPCITLYKKLFSPGSAHADGMIVMNIRQNYLKKLMDDSEASSQAIFLLTKNNNILLNSKNTAITDDEINGLASLPMDCSEETIGDMIFVQTISDKYDLKYVAVNKTSELFALPQLLQKITVVLIIISGVIGFLLAFLLSLNNYRQIEGLLTLLKKAEAGAPLPQLPQGQHGTYHYIQQQIVRSFLENQYLRAQVEARRYRIQAMELMALQAQINPHFLFNTLKIIFWKSVELTKGQNDASRMIESLSEILQYSISPATALVPLREEIRYTEEYVRIQKVRHSNRFEVLWAYPSEIREYHVAKLLFQPLIENSLQHGFADLNRKCFVKVRMHMHRKGLMVSVIDNGMGMPRSALEQLRQSLTEENESNEFNLHVGLANINKRLQLLYGKDVHLKIYSKEGIGTSIRFCLPHS